MEVQAIELIPGQGIYSTFNVGCRVEGSGDIKIEAAMGEFGLVLDYSGSIWSIDIRFRAGMLIKELRESLEAMKDSITCRGCNVDQTRLDDSQGI